MRISDWSSDVCSSDLWLVVAGDRPDPRFRDRQASVGRRYAGGRRGGDGDAGGYIGAGRRCRDGAVSGQSGAGDDPARKAAHAGAGRSEEHTSELQSLMRISYAVLCMKTKTELQ